MKLNFKKINWKKKIEVAEKVVEKDVDKASKFNLNSFFAAIAYLNIFSIVSYALSRKKVFVRFHAKQGLVLFAYFGLSMFSFYVPVLSWIMMAFYVFCVLSGIVNVVIHKEKRLPIIGKIASVL